MPPSISAVIVPAVHDTSPARQPDRHSTEYAVARTNTAQSVDHAIREAGPANAQQRMNFLMARFARQTPVAILILGLNYVFQAAALSNLKEGDPRKVLPWVSLAGHVGVSVAKELGRLADHLGPTLKVKSPRSGWWPYTSDTRELLAIQIVSGISEAMFFTFSVLTASHAGDKILAAHGFDPGQGDKPRALMNLLSDFRNGEMLAYLGPNAAFELLHRVVEAGAVVTIARSATYDANYHFQFCRKPEWKKVTQHITAGLLVRVAVTGVCSSLWLASIAKNQETGYAFGGMKSAPIPAALRVMQPHLIASVFQVFVALSMLWKTNRSSSRARDIETAPAEIPLQALTEPVDEAPDSVHGDGDVQAQPSEREEKPARVPTPVADTSVQSDNATTERRHSTTSTPSALPEQPAAELPAPKDVTESVEQQRAEDPLSAPASSMSVQQTALVPHPGSSAPEASTTEHVPEIIQAAPAPAPSTSQRADPTGFVSLNFDVKLRIFDLLKNDAINDAIAAHSGRGASDVRKVAMRSLIPARRTNRDFNLHANAALQLDRRTASGYWASIVQADKADGLANLRSSINRLLTNKSVRRINVPAADLTARERLAIYAEVKTLVDEGQLGHLEQLRFEKLPTSISVSARNIFSLQESSTLGKLVAQLGERYPDLELLYYSR